MPTISVNGTTLAYDESGPSDGPALVFSHSLFFDRSMFAHQVERFSDEYRVITYDHRGQGESVSGRSGTLDESTLDMESALDMETLTRDAIVLIESLGAAPCHFIGNSMGGFIALRLAARRPDLVLSAVALGSSGDEEGKIADFDPLVDRLRQEGPGQIIDILMYIMFGDTTLTDPARRELREHWRSRMLALPPAIADAAHGVVHRSAVLPELARVSVPILAVAGAEDHAYGPELSERIAETAPLGRWVTVPKAGHSVALERPRLVNDHLAAHLAAFRAVT